MTEDEHRELTCPLLMVAEASSKHVMDKKCIGSKCAFFRKTYMRTPSDVWCGLVGRREG